jgi:pilus assembly protein FimV
MLRKLVVVIASVVLFAAAHAKALGLGEIVLDSALNQPLNAQIALLQLGDVRPEQISVQIADEGDFERFSIARESFLNSIEFDIQTRGANTFVQLSTAAPVREPYLSFVLETRWPSGRLLSEHTLLLDLPAFAATGSTDPIQQPVQAVQQVSQNQSIAVQSSSSTSAQPARLAAPAEPEEEVPALVETPVQAEEVAPPAPVAAPEPAPTPSAASRNANTDETVTIGSQDTLWDVALQIRPDSSVSVQQTMLALQSLNSEAFIADNINMVRRGQVLRIPTLEQIRALSAREAMSEVGRQNQLFENRRNVPLTAQPLTAQPQNTAAAAPGRGELSVVSADNAEPSDTSSGSGTQSAELDARIASLEDALAVQREEADRAALVNAELRARLGLLEEQITSAQEIIRLRDLELAQLQQALAEAAAAEPEPVDPPTVITMAPEKTLVEQILDTLVANTYALLALIGLIILMLVFVLLRRNRAADQVALAGIDGMEVDAETGTAATQTDDDNEIPEGDSSISADLSEDELDEIRDIAGTADAALLNDDDDDDELEEIDPVEEVEAPVAVAPQEPAVPPADTLEEVDALIAYERFDDAEAMLRDAVVAEPDRVDLRMKLLEIFVAKQDAVGFKLQETEIRDMGHPNVEPRIATLRAQLLSETDNEILEEGEEDFFEELNELDDMELALDLEASAEVDDNKVLAGNLEDSDDDDIDFEFELDDDEVSKNEATKTVDSTEEAEKADADVEISFASPEPGMIVEDFDDAEDDNADLSAEFDLSDSDEETISFEVEESTAAPEQADTEPAEKEVDENAIEFDFPSSTPDVDVAEESPVLDKTASEVAADPEHEVEFDFEVIDDEAPAATKVESSPATPEAEVPAIEFDIDDDEDAEIEFLDDEEEGDSADIDFARDDSSFDLPDDAEEAPQEQETQPETEAEPEPEPKPEPEPVPAEEASLDDLEFVDESIDPADDIELEDEDDSEDDDFDFLSDADEAATKLDLARAYFEMGDHDGAREILEEVQKEGSEEQVKDAIELLKKL